VPSRSRCAAVVATLAVTGVVSLVGPGVAGAAPADDCTAAARGLRNDLEALVPATGPAREGTPAADEIRNRAKVIYGTALREHPTCSSQFADVAAALGVTTPPVEGTPFLGPVGWLWNTVYYDVFQGDTVLMVMFGWELLIAPIILLVCAVAVFRGTKGLLRRPYVPPEIRTSEG
jgi:hypothetical protein